MLTGIGASGGIGIGRVLKYVEKSVKYAERTVTDIPAEKERFASAVKIFSEKTEQMAQHMDATGADGEILRGHIAMLKDPYMLSQIDEQMGSGICAERALETVCDMFIAVFSATDDEMTRQRAADVEDIKRQMLKILLGVEDIDLSHLPRETILVVEELTPSMTASMDKQNIKGIITEKGGKTSHSAIISRALKIPAVLSVQNALTLLEDGGEIILDGSAGEVYTDLDAHLRERLLDLREQYAAKEAMQEQYRGRPTVTADGALRELYANIGTHKDIEAALAGDAEGIGLFRTEFLFMDRDSAPSEEEQFEAYKAVAVGMQGREAILRTLDVGGDKEIGYLALPKEENPFLGFRAVRYCLQHTDSYRVQLRAILRASAFGNLAVMIPFVTSVEEITAVRALIEEIKAELDRAQLPYKRDIKVGVMIETPAACMIADLLAEHADFFSIGTNDLIGYVLAADRGNAEVSYLYSPYHPAVLRAIKHTIAAAKGKGIRCGMCGEAAADEKLIPLLLSFGLDEFSVNPTSILTVRACIAAYTVEECRQIEKEALSRTTAKTVEAYLKSV